MTWTVDTTERFGGVNRAPRINPYLPARTEKIGNNTGQASYLDIGKPVKLSGDTVVLCEDGADIYGFIESVEAGTNNGYSIGGVLCDAGLEVLAKDEDGALAVGEADEGERLDEGGRGVGGGRRGRWGRGRRLLRR